jgi:hypothetical protein
LEGLKIISFITYIFLGLFFVIGLINFINPKLMWKLLESWKATKEPSKLYFIMRRIGGLIFMVIPVAYIYFINYMANQK